MKNAKRTLTRLDVDGAKPAAAAYRLWDARVPGLYLRVLPTGVRTWTVRWGEKRDKALGKYPAVTLDVARSRALAVLADASVGTPEFAKPKRINITLRTFMSEHYAPLVEAENRAGAATVANIEAQFGHLYDRKMRDLAQKDFDEFRARRVVKSRDKLAPPKPAKPSTINRDLDRIRAALNQAVAWGMLDANPAAKIKRPIVGEDRVRFLTDEEERRLRAAIDQRERHRRAARARGNAFNAARGNETRDEWTADDFTDHLAPMTLLALNTGMRRGELFKLRWESVDLAARHIRIRAATAKSQKQRFVQLNSEACAVLARWARGREREGLVFPGEDGQPLTTIRTAWTSLMKAAKLKDFRFHDCRHDFASQLVMGGADLNTTRELMGHADIAQTLRYAHLSADHKAAAVEGLVAGNEAPPAASAAAMKLIDDIGDEAALRELMQRLAAKLGATS